MIGHPPEHLFDGFGRLAILATAHIAAHQHLAGILGQIDTAGRSAGSGGVGSKPWLFLL